MEIDLHWGQMHRRIVLLMILVLVTAAAVAFLRPYLPAVRGTQEERVAQGVVRDYLDGVLTPDDPRITGRMAEDVARLAELQPTAFEAFTTRAIVPARSENRAYVVMGVRYRAPAGETHVGEVSVAMVRDGDAWKVDRIWTRPLLRVTDAGVEVTAH